MVQVDIRSLVEAVVRGVGGGRTKVVVDIGEAVEQLENAEFQDDGLYLQCQQRHFSLQRRHVASLFLPREGWPKRKWEPLSS